MPVDHWHEVIADPTIADAVLDRIVHNAHRLALKGDSMRKINAQRAKLDAANKTGINSSCRQRILAAFGTRGRVSLAAIMESTGIVVRRCQDWRRRAG